MADSVLGDLVLGDQNLALRRRWWWTWAQVEGLGMQRLQLIERNFVDLAVAWRAPAAALMALPGIGPELVVSRDQLAKRLGINGVPLECPARLLLPTDPALPPSLSCLQRPPLELHWRGRGSLWGHLRRRRAVAVIGTRRPSPHGLEWAKKLGIALAQAGWPVLSGLAEGIDGAVHQGCLAAEGVPVGVLATSLDRVYPRHHSQLQQEVGKRGLLITEQRPGAAVAKGHFAARNRLLVALAEAVVVVECPDGSGALHGARLAWAEQLPLWVVPADTNRISAKGSNSLLGQGATPLLDPADLLSSLGSGPLKRFSPLFQETDSNTNHNFNSDPLLDALGAGASLEQLAQAMAQPLPQLAEKLLQLELAGLVEVAPDLSWRRRQNGLRFA